MGITVRWDSAEKTIIQWDCEGDWNWEDLQKATAVSRTLMGEVGHKVHIIVDARHSRPVFHNFLAYSRQVNAPSRPANRGMAVVVSQSNFFKVLYDVFVKLYGEPKEFSFAATPEEARAIIAGRQGDTAARSDV